MGAAEAADNCTGTKAVGTALFASKSVEQQSMLAVHRLREGVKEDRNACVNRIQGLLLEFGVAIPTGAPTFAAPVAA